MPLEDDVGRDYIQAMKERNSLRSSTLSFLRAQIKNVKIDKKIEQVPDEEVVSILKKQIKQRQDSITQFESGGRQDLADKEKAELDILKGYLPPEMSEEALMAIVDEVIKANGAASMKDMGKVMKDVLAKTAGSADGQKVGAIVKQRLSGK